LLARGDYIKATEKAWAAAQIVNATKKGKELKSAATRQRNSRRRQRAEEAWSRADVPAKTSTGWTPSGDVKNAVEDVECSLRDSRNYSSTSLYPQRRNPAPRLRRSVLAWGGSCGQLDAALMRLRLEANGSRTGRCEAPTSAGPSG